MFKPTAILLAAALAAGGAFAQEADSDADQDAAPAVLRYQVRADVSAARASGAWPVREYDDVQRTASADSSRKAHRRPRKEYPNVMGMSLQDWLANQL